MTLDEAKNTIAKRYGYPDWESIDWYQVDYSLSELKTKGHAQDLLIDEAFVLCAKATWEEACLAQRKQWIKYMPIAKLGRGDISTTQFVEQLESQPLPVFDSGSPVEGNRLSNQGFEEGVAAGKVINMQELERQRIYRKILKRREPAD